MNIRFVDKQIENVAGHLNDAKTKEVYQTEHQNASKEIAKQEEVASGGVVLQIGKNEDEASGIKKLSTEQIENVKEKESQDKTPETVRQDGSLELISETQKKLLENFNI